MPDDKNKSVSPTAAASPKSRIMKFVTSHKNMVSTGSRPAT